MDIQETKFFLQCTVLWGFSFWLLSVVFFSYTVYKQKELYCANSDMLLIQYPVSDRGPSCMPRKQKEGRKHTASNKTLPRNFLCQTIISVLPFLCNSYCSVTELLSCFELFKALPEESFQKHFRNLNTRYPVSLSKCIFSFSKYLIICL